jgi:hypothetical protein
MRSPCQRFAVGTSAPRNGMGSVTKGWQRTPAIAARVTDHLRNLRAVWMCPGLSSPPHCVYSCLGHVDVWRFPPKPCACLRSRSAAYGETPLMGGLRSRPSRAGSPAWRRPVAWPARVLDTTKPAASSLRSAPHPSVPRAALQLLLLPADKSDISWRRVGAGHVGLAAGGTAVQALSPWRHGETGHARLAPPTALSRTRHTRCRCATGSTGASSTAREHRCRLRHTVQH